MKQSTAESMKKSQEKILTIFLEHKDKFVKEIQVECNKWTFRINSEGIPEKFLNLRELSGGFAEKKLKVNSYVDFKENFKGISEQILKEILEEFPVGNSKGNSEKKFQKKFLVKSHR